MKYCQVRCTVRRITEGNLEGYIEGKIVCDCPKGKEVEPVPQYWLNDEEIDVDALAPELLRAHDALIEGGTYLSVNPDARCPNGLPFNPRIMMGELPAPRTD